MEMAPFYSSITNEHVKNWFVHINLETVDNVASIERNGYIFKSVSGIRGICEVKKNILKRGKPEERLFLIIFLTSSILFCID